MNISKELLQFNTLQLTSATPPAMIIPRADPETPFTVAAPVAYAIGLPVGVGVLLTPVEAITVVGLATPDGTEEVEQGTVT